MDSSLLAGLCFLEVGPPWLSLKGRGPVGKGGGVQWRGRHSKQKGRLNRDVEAKASMGHVRSSPWFTINK